MGLKIFIATIDFFFVFILITQKLSFFDHIFVINVLVCHLPIYLMSFLRRKRRAIFSHVSPLQDEQENFQKGYEVVTMVHLFTGIFVQNGLLMLQVWLVLIMIQIIWIISPVAKYGKYIHLFFLGLTIFYSGLVQAQFHCAKHERFLENKNFWL